MQTQDIHAPKYIEQELVEKAKKGDVVSFEKLVLNYQVKVYKAVYWMVLNSDEASDITQDVFLYAFINIKKYRGGKTFFAWLHWIIIDQCSQRFKKKARRKKHMTEESLDAPEMYKTFEIKKQFGETGTAPTNQILQKERNMLVMRAVNSLDMKFRLPVLLCDIEKLPYKEASEVLECSEGTLKSRLFRARQMLKGKLEKII
ncbi:RNA polymerase sigma factor [bacterium]